jgi:hypothetical protein
MLAGKGLAVEAVSCELVSAAILPIPARVQETA